MSMERHSAVLQAAAAAQSVWSQAGLLQRATEAAMPQSVSSRAGPWQRAEEAAIRFVPRN